MQISELPDKDYIRKGKSNFWVMLSSGQNLEVCDATEADSSTAAGNKILLKPPVFRTFAASEK